MNSSLSQIFRTFQDFSFLEKRRVFLGKGKGCEGESCNIQELEEVQNHPEKYGEVISDIGKELSALRDSIKNNPSKEGDITYVSKSVELKTQTEIDDDNSGKLKITEGVRRLAKRETELTDTEVEQLSVAELNAYEELRWQGKLSQNKVEFSVNEETGEATVNENQTAGTLDDLYYDIPEKIQTLYSDFLSSSLAQKMKNSKGVEFLGVTENGKSNSFSLSVMYFLKTGGKKQAMRSDFTITKNASGNFSLKKENSFEAEEKRVFVNKGKKKDGTDIGNTESSFDSSKYSKKEGWKQEFEQDVDFDKKSGKFSANEELQKLYNSDISKTQFVKENEVFEFITDDLRILEEVNSKFLTIEKAKEKGFKNPLIIEVSKGCPHCENLLKNLNKNSAKQLNKMGVVIVPSEHSTTPYIYRKKSPKNPQVGRPLAPNEKNKTGENYSTWEEFSNTLLKTS